MLFVFENRSKGWLISAYGRMPLAAKKVRKVTNETSPRARSTALLYWLSRIRGPRENHAPSHTPFVSRSCFRACGIAARDRGMGDPVGGPRLPRRRPLAGDGTG